VPLDADMQKDAASQLTGRFSRMVKRYQDFDGMLF
jgi:hypothetical protein